MENSFQFSYLDKIYENAPEIKLNEFSKIVILSDLHVGVRKRRDDFLKNSEMFMYLLRNYYLKNNYKIILNGDVEELHRLPLKKIQKAWPDLFELLNTYSEKSDLYKIAGNHDAELYFDTHEDINKNLLDGIRLNYRGNNLFVFHGHQASLIYLASSKASKLLLKYVAHPLGIKNLQDHMIIKKYIIQKKSYMNIQKKEKLYLS